MRSQPRAPLDLSIYLVTDTVMCGKIGVAASVAAAVGAGATLVQLRDDHATDDDLVSLGRRLASVLEGTGLPLIVNDRVHLVEAIGAHGGHVGQSDLAIARRERCSPPRRTWGCRCRPWSTSRPPSNTAPRRWTTSG